MTPRTLRIAQALARVAALEDRIRLLVRKYSQVPEAQIHEMAQVDPSGPKGTYLEWIVRLTQKGNIRWPEDGGRVRRALVGFHDLKKKPSYFKKYEASPDINTYTLHTLEALYRKVHGHVAEGPSPEQLPPGSLLFYQEGGLQVIKIGGPGTNMEEAAQAACHFGEGTSWCTAAAETAQVYLERGPLFVIFRNGKKIAQTDGDLQLMDIYDEPIEIQENSELWMKLAEIGVFSKGWVAFEYARWVVGGRWPAGEEDILLDPNRLWRHKYITNILTGRWPEAEPYLLRDKNPREICTYCIRVLKGKRWPAGEQAMLAGATPENCEYLTKYSVDIIRDRWPESEPIILRSFTYKILDYMRYLFPGRWPEAESALLAKASEGDPDAPYGLAQYAIDVIEGRWPKAEPYIIRNSPAFRFYTEVLNLDPREFIDEFIKTHGSVERPL